MRQPLHKVPAAKQKRFPLSLKSSSLPKIPLSEELEFPINHLVSVISNLGFRQIILPPVQEAKLFTEDDELRQRFGREMLEVGLPSEKKIVISPTHLLGALKKYVAVLSEEDREIARWFYVLPILESGGPLAHARHELGIFILGEDSIIANAHLMNTATEFLRELGISEFVLELNSLGCKNCQKDYQRFLLEHLQKSDQSLCEECTQKLTNRRFTMWSCAETRCREILAYSPQVVDYLDEACRMNLIGVLETVDALGIPYALNPLVSGQISHERIFFRVLASDPPLVLGEGANYGPWASYLGAEEPVPLLGFVTTLEKLWPLVPPENRRAKTKVEVFLISLGDAASRKILALQKLLQGSGIKTWESLLGRPGIKSQLQQAQDHGSEIALIIGQKEALDETVILRDMRSGMQEVFSHDRIIDEVKKRLG